MSSTCILFISLFACALRPRLWWRSFFVTAASSKQNTYDGPELTLPIYIISRKSNFVWIFQNLRKYFYLGFFCYIKKAHRLNYYPDLIVAMANVMALANVRCNLVKQVRVRRVIGVVHVGWLLSWPSKKHTIFLPPILFFFPLTINQ